MADLFITKPKKLSKYLTRLPSLFYDLLHWFHVFFYCCACTACTSMDRTETLKWRLEFGGILPISRDPYPISGDTYNSRTCIYTRQIVRWNVIIYLMQTSTRNFIFSFHWAKLPLLIALSVNPHVWLYICVSVCMLYVWNEAPWAPIAPGSILFPHIYSY